MPNRVVALGFDSADPSFIAKGIAAGRLPNFQRLRERGASLEFHNKVELLGETTPFSSTEALWVELQAGVKPSTTGYWETFEFNPETYDAPSDYVTGGYDYREFAPFFALGNDFKVATFDVPLTAVVPNVNGLQLCGWGGHWPFVIRGSDPQPLLAEITKSYGKNPILYKDYGVYWSHRYATWLETKSIESIETRTQICLDLLQRDEWDLFFAVYGETHGAFHDLWHASDTTHPVHAAWRGEGDPLMRVFEAVDRSVGAIVDRLPDDVTIVCFSAHGGASNVGDLGSFFFLPELMYRFQFPGRKGFADGDIGEPPLPSAQIKQHHWFGEIWRRKVVKNRFLKAMQPLLRSWMLPSEPGDDILYPYFLEWIGSRNGWMPAVWYQPAWPKMRSFALPSFSEGHVRVNVVGREQKGIVPPEEYDAECDRVAAFLSGAINPRTGEPIVRQVLRTRNTPFENPRGPQSDLVAVWTETPFDIVDSPQVGRIGPVPYHRTGGHRNTGFLTAAGPAVPSGIELSPGEAVDFAPTILNLMGAPVDARFDGRNLLPATDDTQRAA